MDETSYRKRLDDQDWGDVYARLLDFAVGRCGKKKKAQAKDLVQQAITRVYAYDSKWDPEREPDLVRYLMSVVNSLRWNELTSHATQKSASLEDRKTRIAAERVVDAQAFSEEGIADQDLLARRFSLLRERMADDANVLTLIDAMERRLASDEIRAATNWSATTLLAVRRRMLRAAALVARDLGGTSDDDESLDASEDEDREDEEEEVA